MEPGDFVVEEVPAYLPCGEGEHLFLWVEKEDVPAEGLVRHLSQALGVPREEIGVAGLKDRRAVTRQFVSVPARVEEQVAAASTEAIRVLSATRHTNKLKTGHLKGNRFSVLLRQNEPARVAGPEDAVRGPEEDVPSEDDLEWASHVRGHALSGSGPATHAVERAEAIVGRLREVGVPNYYGEQRFGIGGETALLGFALLRGEKTAKEIPYAKRKFLLRLALSAAQSELFNLALADRMRRGELQTVLAGDVMRKAVSGGLFVAEDVAAEQARLEAGETQVTGPLFGPKMPRPGGEPAEREAALLAGAGLPEEAFRRYPKLTAGARRAYVIAVPDLDVSADPAGLRFAFTLPAGAYATVVMREMMKGGGGE